MIMFVFINFYLMPIFAIVFSLNLVGVIKKVKKDESTATNTFWLTSSFALIVWSIAVTAGAGL
ncbi:hypothetical protein [Sporosarcina sp. A2]|uniref:hypothetical protein n=1 Tax=Sporosarcina sp. A2 TaxID=3393449 RepID=UPI003D7B31E8